MLEEDLRGRGRGGEGGVCEDGDEWGVEVEGCEGQRGR